MPAPELPMPLYQANSGLFVAEQVPDSDAVERALNAVDHPIAKRLFVTREVDHGYDTYVWRVMVDNGDQAAECITEWRDDYGRPLPLSSALVDKVQKQIRSGDGERLIDELLASNKRREERVNEEIDEAFQAISEDMNHRLKETRSAGLHRGVHLRRSRARSLESGRDARRRVIGDAFRRMA